MKKSVLPGLILLLLIGCGEVNCPAFPEKFMGWFPQETGDTMIYSNTTDFSVFQIIESYRSSPSSFKQNCDCECMASSMYSSAISSVSEFQISIGCSFSSESDIEFDLTFKNANAEDLFNFRYNKNTKAYEYISSTTDYIIGNQTYYNVAVLEKGSGYSFVKKIFVSPEIGLLGFVDKNDKEWKVLK
jgi:glycogen debranching enzyme